MPAPARLNPNVILKEAVRLLQEEGLDAVTVRRLAARLGVEGASLYKHVGSKQRLLSQVTVHLLMAQVEEVGEHARWQDWLLNLGRVFWATQTRIRDSARLVATTEFDKEQLDAMSALMRDKLTRHGVAPAAATSMHMAVQSLILGLSALAEGRSAALMKEAVPFDAIVEDTLRVLISGWEARLRTDAVSS